MRVYRLTKAEAGSTPFFSVAIAAMLLIQPSDAVWSQGPVSEVHPLIQSVELDSLNAYVSVLTGLKPLAVSDSVLVYRSDSVGNVHSTWYADTVVTLTRRPQMGNEVAAYWLVRKLRGFGLDLVEKDVLDGRPWMQNVLATKLGSTWPERVYVLCAHYDAVPSSPGADDNASGTAAVLEAARVLSDVNTRSTIVFAFWDAEEIGLVGSNDYAIRAWDDGLNLAGVLNLDMIGWDGDGDRIVEIHSDQRSMLMVEEVRTAITEHGLDLVPDVNRPGARNSDHASFWNLEFPALLLIEETHRDFNPRYHSEGDLLQYLNPGYFLEMSRLGLAVAARYALRGATVSGQISELPPEPGHASNWPNPFSEFTRIEFTTPDREPARIRIFDITGQLISEIPIARSGQARRSVMWRPPENMANGVLYYRFESASHTLSGSMVLSR